MSIRPVLFKKYPKEIIKQPVMDERNPLYRDIVLPCLVKNKGEHSEAALIQEFCHIPPQKLSANDLSIFLTFCKASGVPEITNGNLFIQKLIYQSLKSDNEELFLMLLDFVDKEKRSGSGDVLTQTQLNSLLYSVTINKDWQKGMRKLIEMGADVNQDSAGKSLLEHVADQFKTLPEEIAYAKAAILIANGAFLHDQEVPSPREEESQEFSWGNFSALATKPMSNQWITLDFLKELALYHPVALRKLIEQERRLLYRTEVPEGENIILFTASQFIANPTNKAIAELFIELLEVDSQKPFEMWGDSDCDLMYNESSRATLSSALQKACQTGQVEIAKGILLHSGLSHHIDMNDILARACKDHSIPFIEMCLNTFKSVNKTLVDSKILAEISAMAPEEIFGENDQGKYLLSLLAARFISDPDDKENAEIFEAFLTKLVSKNKGKKEENVHGFDSSTMLYCRELHDRALWKALGKNNQVALKIIQARILDPEPFFWMQWSCQNGFYPILEESLLLGADPFSRNALARNAFDEVACGSSKEKEKMILFLLAASQEGDPRVIAKIFQNDEIFTAWSKEANKNFLSLVGARFLKDPEDQDLAKFLEKLIEKSKTSKNETFKVERNSNLAPVLFEKVLQKALEMNLTSLAREIVQGQFIKADLKQQLWWACKIGDLVLIEELLKLGADPYEADADGNTAFHFAKQGKGKEKEKIPQVLLRYGKDVHKPKAGMEGFSPMVAMHFRGVDASSLLTKDEQDFVQKKLSGHASSVRNGGGFEFEKGYAEIMSGVVASSLKDLFADDKEEEDQEVREKLLRVFEQGAAIAEPEAIADQIQREEPALLLAGWIKHAIAIAVIEDPLSKKSKDDVLVAVCNRGDGVNVKENTVQVFRGSRKKFTPKVISEILNNKLKWSKDQGINHYYKVLLQAVSSDGTIVQDASCRILQKELSMSLQTCGNCSLSSLKAALRFFWTVMLHKGKNDIGQDIAATAKRKTKRLSLLTQVNQLANFAARFPHAPQDTVPADEAHYLNTSHRKIKKRLGKITDFPRAKEKFTAIVSNTPFLKALENPPAIARELFTSFREMSITLGEQLV